MKKWICLNCLKEFELEPIYEYEEYEIKGKKIVIMAQKAKCPCCGEYLVNDDATDANLQAAYNTFRQEEKLLFPDEIKAIRQKYGITQVGFSRILGFGDKTIARYENGALQDAAPNNLILLMKKQENFITLWEKRKNRVDKRDIEAVEKRIGYQTLPVKTILMSVPALQCYSLQGAENYGYKIGGICPI